MNKFTYSNPTKVYFGKGSADDALNAELQKYGKTVMLAYGGGSIKHNGIYDEVMTLLKKADKTVIEFWVLCQTPPMKRCRRERCLRKHMALILFLLSGAAALLTAVR